MHLFKLFVLSLLVTTPVFASGVAPEGISTCQNNCYLQKASCNAKKSHTFNACDSDHLACKASCASGSPHKSYLTGIPLDISFHPILDLER
jgi:hypothetical protein